MDSKEFSQIRHFLGKTQDQLARLLCVSSKAIQSYEQGWRNIPAGVERQLLYLLSLKRSTDESTRPCWEITNCPDEWRDNCAAWEYKIGNLCWFVNGTYCQGKFNDAWDKKMETCRECEVFYRMINIAGDR
jgi:DNA-binding XRE family transcriptional regulator